MKEDKSLVPQRMTSQELERKARAYIDSSMAENTKRAYKSDWDDFSAWCDARAIPCLPASPQTVAAYLTELAETRKVSTLERRMVSISVAHKTADLDSPVRSGLVDRVMKGIRRSKGTQQKQAKAMPLEVLKAVLKKIPNDFNGKRDRALLLIGYLGGLRRSEIASICYKDIVVDEENGIIVNIPRSKGDQEGKGRSVALPYTEDKTLCAPSAVASLIAAMCFFSGPLFRPIISRKAYGFLNVEKFVEDKSIRPEQVSRILSKRLKAAGYDCKQFSAHSMRAGIITELAVNGADLASVQQHAGHKSIEMTARYVRSARRWVDNPLNKLLKPESD